LLSRLILRRITVRKLILIISVSSLLLATQDVLAYPVEDFLTEANTLQQVVKDAIMIQNQLTQLQYEATNLKTLGGQNWDDPQQALQQLANSVQQTNGMVYTSNNIDSQYKQIFPGYNAQATSNYSQNYQSWSQTTNNTLNGVLDEINMSYQQAQQEEQLNQQLSQQAQNTQGRMQAIQLGNTIAAEQIAQIQKLKTILMAQTNAQTAYYAYQTQKDTAQQQSMDAMVKNASDVFPSYQNNQALGLMPAFGG
jgi:P-type conjugative transfer protein TrbJ